MAHTDARVDAYIQKAPAFAQPILVHLRRLVHEAGSDITETIKWGMPAFEYKGIVANMAAFKQHCSFGFWKASLLPDPKGVLACKEGAAGSLGRITTLADLPPASALKQLIREAIKLNEAGVKIPKAPAAKKAAVKLTVPPYLKARLQKHPKAAAVFDAFSPSHKKEYVEWILDAKTEATREKRLATMLEWLAAGKTRNWKYQNS
ncbi:MAG TPA: YdeI/OmpD-associated family protein [Sediminibacterium sp.]|nr:YdeI/OmpD-associated family protein [Sediminibacterium sp.]